MSGSDRQAVLAVVETTEAPASRFRWTICALLFFATTVNYADRQILGILAPTLQKEIGWSEAQYGLIVTAFQGAYALGLLGVGRLIDRIGTRWGYPLALGWWSLATMLHGLAASAFGFGGARFLLGLGQAGNFPAAIKTVAEWFPKRERAMATGIFNSGSNAGAILAPLLVPWLTLEFGWRWAFAGFGAAGLVWIVAWLFIGRAQPPHGVAKSAEHISWPILFANRPVWGLLLARFLTDPVWWFYLYWGPKFLNARFGWNLGQIGLPVAAMYLVSSVGGVFGGWFYSYLTRRGRTNNSARKLAMLACALMVVPIVLAPRVASPWLATALIALAMAGHCGWAANIFTIVSDIFPQRAVSSVVGICGFGGATGGMLVSSAVGFVLQATGSYLTIFALASFSYLAGLSIIQLMSPRLEVVNLEVLNS